MNGDKSAIRRRKWLGIASATALASAVSEAAPQRAAAPATGTHVYNIRDFGAVGDGKTLDRLHSPTQVSTEG